MWDALKKSCAAMVVSVLLVTALAAPRVSYAMSPGVRTMLWGGVIGAGLGTVGGLATYPVHGEVRAIFLGTSVGLYLGLAAGLVFAFERNRRADLRRGASLTPQEGRWEAEVALRGIALTRVPTGAEVREASGQPLRFELPVLKF